MASSASLLIRVTNELSSVLIRGDGYILLRVSVAIKNVKRYGHIYTYIYVAYHFFVYHFDPL